MSSDETKGAGQKAASNSQNDPVIKVSFPYLPDPGLEPSSEIVAEPSLKIDYTAIQIPSPKKTVTVRRGASSTRVIHLETDLIHEPAKPPAEKPVPSRKTSSHPAADEGAETLQMVLKHVANLGSAAAEMQRQYAAIATSLEKQSTALPKLDALQRHLDQSHKVETANQRLFDVMHSELKGYKDSFLFDALQKPIIRDLLNLFDDLCGQARRIARFITENNSEQSDSVNWKGELQASRNNIDNTVFFLIEMLNRLDVTMIEDENKILDLKLHKVVGVEMTELQEEKNHIARVIRPGFLWKDRVLRPTEVVVKKNLAPDASQT